MRTGSPRNASFKGRHRAEYAWLSVSAVRGWESQSAAGPSWLISLGDEAARRHNQVPGPGQPVRRADATG